jgi:two-component system sensor histidine kinase KdpD
MLDEGNRRLSRGTDVAVGYVEAHGRAHTTERLADLPIVPRKKVVYRGAKFEEMDLDAVRARKPQVVLVDELAHTNIPGSGPHGKRWQDIETLLDDGIHVISTMNIQHLESLNDVVERITGVQQQETVPDAVVRAADQIEVVDMAPEALRRRMAHGNIYPAEKIDAALGNYFRPGNLTALRELALLWLADSVEEGLRRYRDQHGIDDTWETKERIVVALTGGPEGDTLIRRAARIAARTVGSELLAVHVSRSDGLSEPGVAGLASQRLLVEQLGGTYHSIVGDDVPRTLLDFARRMDATQLVLGASRHHPLLALTGAGTAATVTRLSGTIDVHLVTHDYAARSGFRLPALTGGLTARRRVAGLLVAVVLLPVLTLILTALREHVSFAADVPLYLLAVVLTSVVGGFYPALAAAVAASLLLNYYFVEPRHTLTIDETSNFLALVIFLVIAMLVSRVVDLAARRSGQAARASAEAEAETLSTFAGSLLRGGPALPALLDRVPRDIRRGRREPAAGDRGGRLGGGGELRQRRADAARRRARVRKGRRRADARAARQAAAGGGPAHPRRLRRARGSRLPAARARRGGPGRRAARRIRATTHRLAQRGESRPAHAPRGGQGGDLQPARRGGRLDRGGSP